jgi:hypothetical protein
MNICEEINSLANEYFLLVNKPTGKNGASEFADDNLKNILIAEGEWSPIASDHLLNLAKRYGSFMLKNALALSLALQIEDGDLGF